MILDDRGNGVEHRLLRVGHQLGHQGVVGPVADLLQQGLGLVRVVGAHVIDVHRVHGAGRNHADPRRRQAAQRHLDDFLAVNAVAQQRLAGTEVTVDGMRTAWVGHRGVGLAVAGHRHFGSHHHGGGFRTGQHLRLGHLRLNRLHVLRTERGDEVDLARSEGDHLSDGVADDANDHAVHVGLAGLEVLFPAIHDEVGVWHPLDEAKRAAADHRAGVAALAGLEAVRLRGLRGIEHQAGAIAGQHVQKEGVGPLHVHLNGQRIDHFNALHRLVEAPHAGVGLRVHEAVDAELHGLGVHLVAVVEEGVVAQREGPRQGVVRQLPGRRHVAHELAVGGDVDQSAADVHGHPHHFVARRGMEIEVGDFVAIGHPQRATAFGLGGERKTRQQDGQRQYDKTLDKHVCVAHDVASSFRPDSPVLMGLQAMHAESRSARNGKCALYRIG